MYQESQVLDHNCSIFSLFRTMSCIFPYEKLIENSLILTAQMELVYANDRVFQVLQQLSYDELPANQLPVEILHLCQPFVQSRNLFPNQCWLLHSEILTNDLTCLHIQVRWLQLEKLESPFLLITVEDRHQAICNIAFEEAQTYGLTPREKEVWLLRRKNYTYDQIASELFIAPSTVKKHMASIHFKQKEVLNIRKDLLTRSDSSDRIMQFKYENSSYSDSVRAFVDLTLRPSDNSETKIENQELYCWYVAFCKAHGFQSHSMSRFISRLKKILPQHRVKRQFRRVHGQRLTVRAHWKQLAPIDGVFEKIANLNTDDSPKETEWNCIKSRCTEGGLAKFLLGFDNPNLVFAD